MTPPRDPLAPDGTLTSRQNRLVCRLPYSNTTRERQPGGNGPASSGEQAGHRRGGKAFERRSGGGGTGEHTGL